MFGRIGRGEFLVLSIFSHNQSNPAGIMQDDTTLAQQISVAAAATHNVNCEFDADEQEAPLMLGSLFRQGMKLKDFDWYLAFYQQHEVKLHSSASVGVARVTQFILGQKDIHNCVSFLTNRENVI
jgi:asparaginyl-tRNA synthetase